MQMFQKRNGLVNKNVDTSLFFFIFFYLQFDNILPVLQEQDVSAYQLFIFC